MTASDRYLGLFDSRYVNNFAFTPGAIPLSTFSSIATAVLAYLVLVLSLKQYIRHRGKPYDLRRFSIYYNAALSVMSFFFLVQHLREVSRLLSTHSFWSVFCDEKVEHTRGSHVFWYYVLYDNITHTHYALLYPYGCSLGCTLAYRIFLFLFVFVVCMVLRYLSKFLELSDTVLLCLRGKSTPFIHVYHHAITVFFAFLHLHEQTCIAWTMPILNLTVHVFLYAYFALHEAGQRVWWKKWLTTLQVTQFYITFIPSIIALVPRVIFTINPTLPLAHACHGSWTGVGLGIPLLVIYLVMFQRLLSKYEKPVKGAKDAASMAVGAKAAVGGRGVAASRGVGRVAAASVAGGESSTADEQLRSSGMWGADSVPYWRRKQQIAVAAQ